MLRKSLLVLLTLIGLPSQAQETLADLCPDLAVLAERIMTARQDGTDILEMYEWGGNAGDAVSGLVREMITEAYDSPRFSGEEMKARSISEFKNEMMVQCMRSAN